MFEFVNTITSFVYHKVSTAFAQPEMTAKHIEVIKNLISANKVFVASKSYCPYCKAAKSTLRSFDVDPKVIELDHENEGAALQQALTSITGMRTVPQIFINGQFIGGNSDLQALDTSKLKTLLAAAKL